MGKNGSANNRLIFLDGLKKKEASNFSQNDENDFDLNDFNVVNHSPAPLNDKKIKGRIGSVQIITEVFKQKLQQVKVGVERDYYFNSNSNINAIIPMVDVLLQDPYAIEEFCQDGNVVYIPMPVIHHLNELKGKPGLSEDAMKAGEIIEKVAARCDGSLIIFRDHDAAAITDLGLNRNDFQHLAIASANKIYNDKRTEYKQVKFISLSSFNRIVAKQLGSGRLKIEDYLREHISSAGKSKTLPTINVDKRKLRRSGDYLYFNYSKSEYGEIVENDGVICYDKSSDNTVPADARLNGIFCAIKNGKRLIVIDKEESLFGLKPLSNSNKPNFEQIIAIHKLLDPRYSCHLSMGDAGSGKTLLSLGAALNWLYNSGYGGLRRILFISPMVHVGGEDNMGFLPGKIDDKLAPWIRPAIDNIEVYEKYNLHLLKTDNHVQPKKARKQGKLVAGGVEPEYPKNWLYNKLKRESKLFFEPLDYLRGRTINNAYMIVDDAQNLTRHEIKTIITRAGNDTIINLTGDITQTDRVINLYGITRVLNGFAYATQHLCGQPEISRIIFNTSVRSNLAALGNKYL